MTTQEYQFCETKGKHMTLLNPIAILRILRATPRLSFQNIFNVAIVTKECIKGKSNSWLIHAEFQENPILKTIPLTKRKLSEVTVKLMAEGYQDSANDDLALAKEFEGSEPQIDDDTDQ